MLIGLRAVLGIGEAGFTGVPFYLSFFYKRHELAFRTAIFISAAPLASSFASTLAWLIVKFGEASPIAPWRVLFLVEGFPSVLPTDPRRPLRAPYLLAFAFVLATARASDNARARSPFIILHALLSLFGYTCLAYAEPWGLSPPVRYLALFPACVGFFSVVALTVTWSINNQPSESRQGGGFALLQIVGQCGPLLGTRLYPATDAPFYATGMHTCAAAMLGVVLLALLLRFYMRWWNTRMDRQAIEGNLSLRGEEEEGLVGPGLRRRSARNSFRYML
ncbi:unnamed protein product [Parascedosporium putredinis]|uniref:MFS transporter n=1 Tax=Parascedosporium putredinis TaxID=1442378 RepID=A0A9P1M7G8_9PEZI|nr:unnamed protein product [Parascedosporium putredinis]CAI7987688.1 unnamed protein product [Parascedosporium putredinis]